MRFSSTAAFFALSSLCASYVLPFTHPQQSNDNLMRRELPYAVVNVDSDDQTTSGSSPSSSNSNISPVIQTAVKTVTASSPPSPPVTVTVTTTAFSTPIISSFPCSSSTPVSSLSLPPLSRAGTLITVPSPSRTASSVSGQTSSGSLSSTVRATSTTDHH
ncbi:uncharacterized protein ASPGLDRAFT_45684 [Aspergillus glaucus CBS 516.65]|uniref:REJ domain-containing protein n=1 Tax=Aspergillus glaucus CBS 516.65 TaxID=1160497 RepID=A0A1L9VP54_ASPGL|nr:hypothetical protein ASPGLDRAFT_45684 [Aspergillus glaucus CBS 516.65]OJJ85686.1 hypothetical protein ASPGLDRAFT_45684 [Aspergillus glaucus CBS 516.65]